MIDPESFSPQPSPNGYASWKRPVSALERLQKIIGLERCSPARRIVTGSGARMRGYFSSIRFDKSLPWESPIERDFLRHVEFSNFVVDVESQPARLFLRSGDLMIDYTPDFMLIDADDDQIALVECKPDSKLDDPELRQRLRDIRNVLLSFGIRFVIVTDSQLENKQINANISLLLKYRTRWNSFCKISDSSLRMVDGAASWSFGDLVQRVSRDQALHIIAAGYLTFNFGSELNNTTPVQHSNERKDDVIALILSK
jgi:hypothetical protein